MKKSIISIFLFIILGIAILVFPFFAEAAPAVTLTNAVVAGQNAASQSFHVKNDGGGMLDYVITSNALWAIPGTAFGGASSENNLVIIKYSTAFLEAGAYSAIITIDDPAAGNSPQTVLINMTITPKPAIGILP